MVSFFITPTLRTGLLTTGPSGLVIAGNEYHLDSPSVLKLAAASGLAAYDCEFVALAQRLGVPLVTTDKKLLSAFPAVAATLASAAK